MSSSMFLLVLCIGIVSQTASCTTKERLARDLTKDYLPYIDPGTDTKLKVSVSYLCADYDEKTHELTSKVFEYYSWKDSRLVWLPSEYNGITNIRMPAKLLWTPDMMLYNSLDYKQDRAEVNTVVYNNGTVLWVPPTIFRTRCSPTSGSISCKISLGSWTYDAVNVPLVKYETGFDTSMYLSDTCPYTISNPTVEIDTKVYPCCEEPYSTLVASFDIKPRE